MKHNISSFYNAEENTIDDKAYAHYYLALISTILPYFENDNIVENYKELVTKPKEAIFNLDHNTTGQLQEDTLSADAFIKDVLGQTGDVISKQITSYTYNGTGLETAR